ncbi:ABC transporter ATP-binding protein [Cocleimonas flava]|uniref:Amino acid/amide ABC transporter ATP-binding protein 1 (HAAT family) n=1 Tax=Cocleimonas flava TaxID=634765 RepID=A0A4R1F8D4_9GAMM|nr:MULTISPECIES: ABC transporter ATP-binding protein [Cocleimonas]MEB8431269.1 ABC transporter ATP-binding protein [Cocleimonas sp. KMM 6892]MEC4713959.1 ABC transporter ATP-binding protein [Cocleimonas sp. KMM 6895]MEC4743290.1 ABC transporter ATP-binding protein [Cocleimonas sp. KMM 6896]TCJ88949.1 amino acid/amide ABC transporter ATP-binding protein 1 (HAAT family) [Cocleimonas flava]
MSNILEIKGVNKTFGGLHALQDVNLQIEEGETHAIIGPNGAGKSTLLNCCIGRLIPDNGSVTFNGKNMIGMEAHDINHAGMVRVFQTPEIFPELTLLENVMIPALAKRDGTFKFNPFKSLLKETAIHEEAMATLADFNLDRFHDHHAGSMSRGDKRRLELAMGLIQHPTLLLLDEPTAGMARHDTNATIDLLKSGKMGEMTKVIIEHDMHVVFSLADRISVLARGHIIATGTPEEIKNDPKVKEAYLGEQEDE